MICTNKTQVVLRLYVKSYIINMSQQMQKRLDEIFKIIFFKSHEYS